MKVILRTLLFSLLLIGCLLEVGFAKNIVKKSDGKVQTVKYDDGTWALLVSGKPYFIKGVVFGPTKIGEDPGNATMRDWMRYDDDHNGNNDIAYQTWIDANKNNKQDHCEKPLGDFQLLKDLGCNTIRLYHIPSDNNLLGDIYRNDANIALQYDHPVNKELLRSLYSNYHIMVIMGNFLGSWTVGSGASWEEGTDYTNPEQCEKIKKSVKAMVLDNKDEPYVLMWQLGNENNIASWSQCNAKKEPVAYAKLVGEIADMIHQLDPDHPVAVCDGDDNGRMLPYYAKYAPGIDIMSYNSYRGQYGFGTLWMVIKRNFDRPVFISEWGVPAYNKYKGEDEDFQRSYIKGCWHDISANGAGNSIGGTIFEWVDMWWINGNPNEHNEGTKHMDNFPDKLNHEEWFGIVSMGDGSDSLMRQKRKGYDYLKSVWHEN